jgi:two-component system OmpR family response regulator
MRVLVVEDERRMAGYICQALVEEGFAVDCAYDGRSALDMVETYEYDVIVLDLMLPGIDGLTLCERVRKGRQAHLRADPVGPGSRRGSRHRPQRRGPTTTWSSRSPRRNCSRGCARCCGGGRAAGAPVLRVGSLELHPSTRLVKRGAQTISLTAKEYALLEYLMRRPSVVLTRTMIAEHVWDFTFDLSSNVVDVYVKHLRDKINEPGKASFIQTVRGVGYTVMDPEAVEA